VGIRTIENGRHVGLLHIMRLAGAPLDGSAGASPAGRGRLDEMIVLDAFRGSRGRTRIALVDDDALYREAMSAELEDRGFSVDGFADGEALLAALQRGFQAHVALVDWSLPYMSGLNLLRTMRGAGHGLPVAFLTGRPHRDYQGAAMAAGAVDFIDKTCGIEELVAKLSRIIGKNAA
jgi:FixJ family two-component response regulator